MWANKLSLSEEVFFAAKPGWDEKHLIEKFLDDVLLNKLSSFNFFVEEKKSNKFFMDH